MGFRRNPGLASELFGERCGEQVEHSAGQLVIGGKLVGSHLLGHVDQERRNQASDPLLSRDASCHELAKFFGAGTNPSADDSSWGSDRGRIPQRTLMSRYAVGTQLI